MVQAPLDRFRCDAFMRTFGIKAAIFTGFVRDKTGPELQASMDLIPKHVPGFIE